MGLGKVNNSLGVVADTLEGRAGELEHPFETTSLPGQNVNLTRGADMPISGCEARQVHTTLSAYCFLFAAPITQKR